MQADNIADRHADIHASMHTHRAVMQTSIKQTGIQADEQSCNNDSMYMNAYMQCAHSHFCSIHVFNSYPEATVSAMSVADVLFSDLGPRPTKIVVGKLVTDLGSSTSPDSDGASHNDPFTNFQPHPDSDGAFHKDPFIDQEPAPISDGAGDDLWDLKEISNMDAIQLVQKL